MLCTVMAWGSEIVVNNFNDLKTALSSSGTADVVKLGQDIAYATNGSDLLNIERSLTLDGNGHTITGWGKCMCNHDDGVTSYALTPLAINAEEKVSGLVVTLKGLTLSTLANTVNKVSSKNTIEVGLLVMDGVNKLTVSACDIRSHMYKKNETNGANMNPGGIVIWGTTSTPLDLTVEEGSYISAGTGGYGLYVLRPIDATINNSSFEGFSSITFYAQGALQFPTYKTSQAFGKNNYGSMGSSVTATNSNFYANNVHSGNSNGYAMFAFEDGGIEVVLDNCSMNAQALGNAKQFGFMASPKTPIEHRSGGLNITLKGDNSHINGSMIYAAWHDRQVDAMSATAGTADFIGEEYAYWGENGISLSGVDHSATRAFTNAGDITFTILGGTYSQKIDETRYAIHLNSEYPSYSSQFFDIDAASSYPTAFIWKNITIPATHEVQTVKQQDGDKVVTLYRVVKKADGTQINDNAGQNEDKSIAVATGSTITLNQPTTEAGYVQVKNNNTNLVVGPSSNQTLTISNGLDVQDNAQVTVKPGSAVVIGEGGITTEKPENIVIEANENGAASLLLDPTITVNQTPNLTVRMTAKQIGRDAAGDFYWHRYAMPVASISGWDKEGSLVGAGSYEVQYRTYVYAWDYSANDWVSIAPNAMAPLKGYTLTLASDYIHVNGEGKVTSEATKDGNLNTLQDVTYIFKGNLVGNTDQPLTFEKEGFNYFGNSYTGYMHALTVLNGIESEHVDGTIYMWNAENQNYAGVSKNKLSKNRGLEEWQKEIAPMQTFILRLRGADSANEGVSYSDAIWNNPRYGNAASAPARQASVSDEDAYMEIIVTAANGKSDVMDFTEMTSKSDAFESGYDAEKYMNRKSLNLYADVDGINLSSVVTDNLLGKTLSLQTVNDVYYTMTFDNVEGNEYALLDKATNEIIVITNGASYAFSAQPNTTVENRFEIVSAAKVPTAVENVEAAVKARGIYTMLGQYMGEDLNVLPAGVYIVNGVKIVK